MDALTHTCIKQTGISFWMKCDCFVTLSPTDTAQIPSFDSLGFLQPSTFFSKHEYTLWDAHAASGLRMGFPSSENKSTPTWGMQYTVLPNSQPKQDYGPMRQAVSKILKNIILYL